MDALQGAKDGNLIQNRHSYTRTYECTRRTADTTMDTEGFHVEWFHFVPPCTPPCLGPDGNLYECNSLSNPQTPLTAVRSMSNFAGVRHVTLL